MVAAHIEDLRAAASVGMKTVYVRRVGEDPIVRDGELVKRKDEGGEVDRVVDSFLELSAQMCDILLLVILSHQLINIVIRLEHTIIQNSSCGVRHANRDPAITNKRY